MLHIDIRGIKEVQDALKQYPIMARKACVSAMRQVTKESKLAVVKEMQRVFDRPTRFTLNSLRDDPPTMKSLTARLYFREPDRSSSEKISGVRGKEHYLGPQVYGGARQLKGFERIFGGKQMVPGSKEHLDQYGNVSHNKILQIMSVLGKLSRYQGDACNITNKYRKINTKERDYVYIPKRRGNLRPGIYKRNQTGVGFGRKTKRLFSDRSRSYQLGNRKVAVRDPISGKILRWITPVSTIQSIVRARGLSPVLIQASKQPSYSPRLDFYGVARRTFNREFVPRFWKGFHELNAIKG